MKYVLVDTANTFFRARHAAFRAADLDTKLGFAMHVTLAAVNKVAKKFDADHVVFCLEGRSWRKDVYEPYKANRKVARAKLTDAEIEEDTLFWEIFDDLNKYLQQQTNCTVLRHPKAEADDMIARWIALHPTDEHIILSSDTDYVQLLTPQVMQYNGITEELISLDGIFNDKDERVIDKKTKEPKEPPNPKWLLFEKCMRGDSSDNVFSAYPGVRTKSTKKKVGLLEAFEDKEKQGYAWNNLMLQRWTDHDDNEHRVVDDYQRNVQLIDLTAQPQELKDEFDAAIREEVTTADIGQVGIRFMRFCGKHDLNRISEQAADYGRWLGATYKGDLQ
jgi:5'-3' exonuclease